MALFPKKFLFAAILLHFPGQKAFSPSNLWRNGIVYLALRNTKPEHGNFQCERQWGTIMKQGLVARVSIKSGLYTLLAVWLWEPLSFGVLIYKTERIISIIQGRTGIKTWPCRVMKIIWALRLPFLATGTSMQPSAIHLTLFNSTKIYW